MKLNTNITTALIVLAAGMLASGCLLRTRGSVGVTAPPPPSASVSVSANVPPPPSANIQIGAQVATGVTVIEASCVQGSAEVCNGLDDNCNGQIDEGCGYASGAIQITLAWGGGADLDLYVTDPAQETLSYSHRNVGSGGELDQDARGNCRPNQPNNTIENVYWNTPTPPAGAYSVQVHYWGECNSNSGPTTATLAISVGGAVRGAWQYTLVDQQRLDVAQFTI